MMKKIFTKIITMISLITTMLKIITENITMIN